MNSLGNKLCSLIHRTIAMFSDSGVNLIVDHILHDNVTIMDWQSILNHYPVFIVAVHCPLIELERREQARGDRQIGQARKQLDLFTSRKRNMT
jgi:chloramphenicol 3-O phosphotransferase